MIVSAHFICFFHLMSFAKCCGWVVCWRNEIGVQLNWQFFGLSLGAHFFSWPWSAFQQLVRKFNSSVHREKKSFRMIKVASTFSKNHQPGIFFLIVFHPGDRIWHLAFFPCWSRSIKIHVDHVNVALTESVLIVGEQSHTCTQDSGFMLENNCFWYCNNCSQMDSCIWQVQSFTETTWLLPQRQKNRPAVLQPLLGIPGKGRLRKHYLKDNLRRETRITNTSMFKTQTLLRNWGTPKVKNRLHTLFSQPWHT